MQLAGGIIGAAIGAPFGFAALGWSLGSTLGGLLTKPPQQVHAAPKMDLRVPGTQDGRPIPWIRGAMRVAPDWAWHTDRRATTIRTESGGGGGGLLGGLFGGAPKVVTETTTYDMDALLMLDINGGIGVAEIFRSGELIWKTDSGASSGTIAASNNTDLWDRLTVYTGAADQLADPDYEAAILAEHPELSSVDIPAYRGRMTVFIKGLKLGSSGQVPQLEFVVVVDGANEDSYTVFPNWVDIDTVDEDRSVALDLSRGQIWLNEITTNPNAFGGLGNVGYYDFATETFTRITLQSPFLKVRAGNDPAYHSNVIPGWNVYIFLAQNSDGSILNTFYVDLDSKEIIGDVYSATGGVLSNGGYVACPDPDRSRVLIGLGGGDFSLYSTDSRGLPESLLATITGMSGTVWIGVDNDGNYWLNRDSFLVTQLAAAGLAQTNFTFGGLVANGYQNQGCWPFDSTRNCFYFFDKSGAADFEHLYRFNCSDQSVEQVNSVAFDVTAGGEGKATYDSESDRIGVQVAGFAYVLDPDSGAVEHSIDLPSDGNDLDGGQLALTSTSLFGAASSADSSVPGGFGEWRFNALTVDCPSVEDVQQSLCLRAGLTAGQVNVSPLSAITREVCCLPWSNISAARVPSETLMGAYFYESTMSGTKVKFVPRGAAAVDTIPYEDLGVHMAGEANEEDPLPLRLVNDLETPAFSHINYINLASNYTDGSETTDRLISTSAVTNQPLDVSLGMQPEEAKGVIDTVHRDRAAALLRARIGLLRSDYPTLEPTDCITVTGPDDSEYRVRIIQIVDRFPMLECDVVMDDPNVLSNQGITTTDYEAQTTVPMPANTILRLADLPLLRTEEDYAGLTAAAKGDSTPWHGALILDSVDDVTFNHVATIEEAAIFGTCTTALGDYTGPRVVDFKSRVRVNVGNDELTSSTRGAVLASPSVNAYAIGDTATGYECGQFINAELISADPNIYELSNLIRGSRGTNWRMTDHAAGERFFLLRGDVRKLRTENAQIGATLYYKGVTRGRPESTATSQTAICNGVAQKPFSPAKVRVSRDGSNNATITITRRTRVGTRYTGALGVSVPLGEQTEAYSIDFYTDDTFTTVAGTLSVIGTNVIEATAAAQTGAGLTPGDPLHMDVYMLSSIVGRGYPLRRSA